MGGVGSGPAAEALGLGLGDRLWLGLGPVLGEAVVGALGLADGVGLGLGLGLGLADGEAGGEAAAAAAGERAHMSAKHRMSRLTSARAPAMPSH